IQRTALNRRLLGKQKGPRLQFPEDFVTVNLGGSSMYARMMIGDAISEDAITEFEGIYQEHAKRLAQEPGFVSSQLLIEHGGVMLITLTIWKDPDACFAYHTSRHNRQYVTAFQHLIVSDFVVKLFRCPDDTVPLVAGTRYEKEVQP